MKLSKKARMSGIIGFIIVVLVVILMVYLMKNGWNIQAAVKDMLGMFGASKK